MADVPPRDTSDGETREIPTQPAGSAPAESAPAAEATPHKVARLLEANEVAARPLLSDQSVRDSLPPVAKYNASATGTDAVGYFSEGHGVSAFAREGASVYHCYSSYARGTEFLMGYYAILDRTPKGRAEVGPMGTWLRRHDEYDA